VAHKSFTEAMGCKMSCVVVETGVEGALRDLTLGRSGALPALQTGDDRNAWQTFAGRIVNIEHTTTRGACPYCRARTLQELVAPEEESSSGQAGNGPCRYLCLQCHQIFDHKPVRMLEPCMAVIEAGLVRSEVWLGEQVIQSLGLQRIRRSSDVKAQMCGRAIKGVALRCCDFCTSSRDRTLALWATEACMLGE
jgi:DNA-directed RNA polymerase subunit RPC12/RpoP